MTNVFHGAKIALLCGERLLAYRRDDFAHLPNPGLWDLPGGGREDAETPAETVLRETEEEFGIALPAECVTYARRYASIDHPGHWGWFLAGTITPDEVAAIRFGSEGQEWAMLPVADFLARADAVPHLRFRLSDYLATVPA